MVGWLACTVVIPACLSLAQQTGPFGLTAGMTRKQVEQIVGAKAVVSQKGDDVTYSTVPEPYPLFEQYILTFSRKYGLVEVEGTVFDILDDRSGSSTRSKCEDIHSTLSKKYGKPRKSSGCELKAKTECTEPSDLSAWDVLSPRSDKVDAVYLMAFLTRTTQNERGESVIAGCHEPHIQWKGMIQLIYMFDDFSKYQAEVKSTL
jgi:hypothetical protein